MSLARTSLWLLVSLLLATPSLAQELAPIEIDRRAAELGDALKRPVDPVDPDLVESVLVFTSEGDSGGARCVAHDGRGNVLGVVTVRVPRNGLRFIRARDFSGGTDYVGSANCRTKGPINGSAFLLAPGGVSDLPVLQRPYDPRLKNIVFPVVASY
ncbi:MAG: hypothetical protein QNK05_21710 [Myxococcota bacterium]|nr:hypothetical protein [Myxococcota bacterium]